MGLTSVNAAELWNFCKNVQAVLQKLLNTLNSIYKVTKVILLSEWNFKNKSRIKIESFCNNKAKKTKLEAMLCFSSFHSTFEMKN